MTGKVANSLFPLCRVSGNRDRREVSHQAALSEPALAASACWQAKASTGDGKTSPDGVKQQGIKAFVSEVPSAVGEAAFESRSENVLKGTSSKASENNEAYGAMEAEGRPNPGRVRTRILAKNSRRFLLWQWL